MTSLLKIEAGKTYVARNGCHLLVQTAKDFGEYRFETDAAFHLADGRVWEHEECEYDIVAGPILSDPVNRPDHYTAGAVECIDAIKAAMTPEAFRGYLKGNAIKYFWRYEQKGGVESLQKARWYTDRLIAELT